MAPPSKYLQNFYNKYSDNNENKEVCLQAAGRTYLGTGDRHVTLLWENGHSEDGANTIIQLIQLTGGSGNYNFYSPVAESRRNGSISGNNELFSLGIFSRPHRDRIIEIADGIHFAKKSNKNGCRVWTRDILQALVQEGLISQSKFEEVDKGVPLVVQK
jgi:hypothetical protein